MVIGLLWIAVALLGLPIWDNPIFDLFGAQHLPKVLVLFYTVNCFNLETAVGRTRGCIWEAGWRETTRRRLNTCNEERQRQMASQTCNRVRSEQHPAGEQNKAQKPHSRQALTDSWKRSTAVSRFNVVRVRRPRFAKRPRSLVPYFDGGQSESLGPL